MSRVVSSIVVLTPSMPSPDIVEVVGSVRCGGDEALLNKVLAAVNNAEQLR